MNAPHGTSPICAQCGHLRVQHWHTGVVNEMRCDALNRNRLDEFVAGRFRGSLICACKKFISTSVVPDPGNDGKGGNSGTADTV